MKPPRVNDQKHFSIIFEIYFDFEISIYSNFAQSGRRGFSKSSHQLNFVFNPPRVSNSLNSFTLFWAREKFETNIPTTI